MPLRCRVSRTSHTAWSWTAKRRRRSARQPIWRSASLKRCDLGNGLKTSWWSPHRWPFWAAAFHYDYRDVAYKVAIAFVVFCLAASSTYLINDARDVHADRQHPTKSFRPIAAGLVAPALAYTLAIALGATSLAISLATAPTLAVVIGIYLAIQLGYNFGLKHLAVLDICLVSSGFLIRAIAGGAATGIPLSQWFLLVMAFASLFAVAGKRYAELQVAERTGAKIRKALRFRALH